MAAPSTAQPPVKNAENEEKNKKQPAMAAQVPLEEQTARSTSTLASFSTVTSAREPEWMPPKKPQNVINLTDLMKEERTQSPEAKTPVLTKQPPDSGGEKTAKLPQGGPLNQVKLVSDGTRVYSENVLNQEQFDKKFGFRRVNLSLIRVLEGRYHQVGRWKRRDWCSFLKSRVPIVDWLPKYSFKHDLLSDVIGGLMVSIMNIPQGLAYGFLVGLPPIHGLYTGIVGPLIYALLGTSRHAAPGRGPFLLANWAFFFDFEQ